MEGSTQGFWESESYITNDNWVLVTNVPPCDRIKNHITNSILMCHGFPPIRWNKGKRMDDDYS